MKIIGLPVVAVLLLLSACASPRLYEWGGYEPSLYKLMKNPQDVQKYGEKLLSTIERGESSGKVPPGLYAEYGYVLVQLNKPQEAIAFFEKEKTHWPESSVFMNKMIISCKSGGANQKVDATAPPQSVEQHNGVVVPSKEGK